MPMILHVRHSSGVIRCCGVSSTSAGNVVGVVILLVVVLDDLADGGKTDGTDFQFPGFEPN